MNFKAFMFISNKAKKKQQNCLNKIAYFNIYICEIFIINYSNFMINYFENFA